MDLKQAMQEATDSPPPTGIDVDRLIASERRRGTSIRLAGFAAVVTVLAFGATMLPRYFGESLAPPVVAASGDRTPGPTVTAPASESTSMPALPSGMPGSIKEPCAQLPAAGLPAPRQPVTEDCQRATGRLTATYGFQIEEMVTGHVGGLALRFVRDPAVAVGYSSGRDYDRDGHRFTITIRAAASSTDQAGWELRHPCGTGCHRQVVNGVTVQVTDGRNVEAFRPDGTEIVMTVDGGDYRPLTEDQLVTLVTVPELTLYPTVS
ncbi:hypothetical protein ACQP00_52095 [Dactylosporangium sp. CS-047395]|uniref:hypothetical protein n=1 Tax=Dactylosporangium sp. CS-047395 TaxID=3239936 RepID=UPI003D8AA35E